MTLPASFPLSSAQINVELGRAANAAFSIGGAAERQLAGVPSGPISFSNFLGKSAFAFVPFATPYGVRGGSSAVGATSPQTANADSRVTLLTDGTLATAGFNTASNPSGYTQPVSVRYYNGTPATTVWAYFNRIDGAGTFSAGNAWVNASTANQSVTCSATATDTTLNNGGVSAASSATYDVYVVQSASQPAGGPQGTLLGRIRIEASAFADRDNGA